MNHMKYFSLFSGVGGFEIGIDRAYEQNQRLVNQIEKAKEQDMA